jgi:indole-3-glycerol phosphate synthase
VTGATEKTPNRDDSRITPEVQATSTFWTPPGGVLGEILSATRQRLGPLIARGATLDAEAAAATPAPPFGSALRSASVAVIAEVKRRSPSRGILRDALSAPEQALAYEAGGASAISVLTEPEHFGGSPADVVAARQAVKLPLLRKDFIIDPRQVVETRAMGASALLLICRALEPGRLRDLIRSAADWKLEALVEVRDPAELDRALAAGARIIGINNRNLETLEVDASTAERLLPLVPPGIIAVAESGIAERGDVERAAAAGADAVLVGSALSASSDPVGATRALTGVARRDRRG